MDTLFRPNTKYFDVSYIITNNDLIDTILSVTKYLIQLNNIIYKLYVCITNKEIIDIVPYYAINTLLYEIIHSIDVININQFFTNIKNIIINSNNIYGNNGNNINLFTTKGLQHKSFDDISNYYNSIKIDTFDDIYEIIKYNMYEITHNENITYNNNLIQDYYNKGIQLLNELNAIGITKYINKNNTLKNISHINMLNIFKKEMKTKDVKMNVVTMRIKRQIDQLKGVNIVNLDRRIAYLVGLLSSIYEKYKHNIYKIGEKISILKTEVIVINVPSNIIFINIKSYDCVTKNILYLCNVIMYNYGKPMRIDKRENKGIILLIRLYNKLIKEKKEINSNYKVLNSTYEKVSDNIYRLLSNDIRFKITCISVLVETIKQINNIINIPLYENLILLTNHNDKNALYLNYDNSKPENDKIDTNILLNYNFRLIEYNNKDSLYYYKYKLICGIIMAINDPKYIYFIMIHNNNLIIRHSLTTKSLYNNMTQLNNIYGKRVFKDEIRNLYNPIYTYGIAKQIEEEKESKEEEKESKEEEKESKEEEKESKEEEKESKEEEKESKEEEKESKEEENIAPYVIDDIYYDIYQKLEENEKFKRYTLIIGYYELMPYKIQAHIPIINDVQSTKSKTTPGVQWISPQLSLKFKK